jgi:hypothetical protein
LTACWISRPHRFAQNLAFICIFPKPFWKFPLSPVSYTKKGVQVNDQLQTTQPDIYAAGDICSPYEFTHAADFMARTVIRNALFFGRAKASALTIPWCTYTEPEIARVGLYPKQAEELGVALDTFTRDLAEVDRAVLEGRTKGFVRVHVRNSSDTIAGATIVAQNAGDMISEITLAMTNGLGLKHIAAIIHPYPGPSSVVSAAPAMLATRESTDAIPSPSQAMSVLTTEFQGTRLKMRCSALSVRDF